MKKINDNERKIIINQLKNKTTSQKNLHINIKQENHVYKKSGLIVLKRKR